MAHLGQLLWMEYYEECSDGAGPGHGSPLKPEGRAAPAPLHHRELAELTGDRGEVVHGSQKTSADDCLSKNAFNPWAYFQDLLTFIHGH